jgi:hypothetical protein
MASDTNINAILTQGNTVKNIFNAKKQSLELQQQFAAQQTEVKSKKDRVKVKTFETDNRIEQREENEKNKKEDLRKHKKKFETKAKKEDTRKKEGSLLDIKV